MMHLVQLTPEKKGVARDRDLSEPVLLYRPPNHLRVSERRGKKFGFG